MPLSRGAHGRCVGERPCKARINMRGGVWPWWAAVLAQQLGQLGDVPSALQAFAAQRWQRNAQVQRRAVRNGQVFHARGPMRWARDVGLHFAAPMLMDQPWLYGHQVLA